MRPTRPPPLRPTPPPGKIRIIGGTLRGSKIDIPELPGLRPTPDRVRETLFNWLQPTIDGARCLDLFAGSGALGLEAASRGAREVVLVERELVLARKLQADVARLKIVDARVVCRSAEDYLNDDPQPFDVVFLDPPFAAALWESIAARLESQAWLAPGAWIYVESPATIAPAVPDAWSLHREGRAGEVRYALYRSL